MSLDKTLLDIAKSAVDTQRKSRDGRNVVSRGVDAATNKSYANEDKKVAAAALRQWENSTWKPKVEAKLKQELKTRAPHLKPGSKAYQQTYDSLYNKNHQDLQAAKTKTYQQLGTLRQKGQTQRQVDDRYTQKESLRNNTAKIQSAASVGRDVAEEAAGALATGGSKTLRYPLQFAADIGENDDGGIFDRGAKALERHEDNLQQVYPAYADTQQNGSFTERLTLSAIEQIPSIALSFAGAGAAAKGVQLAGAGAKTTAAVSYGTAAATMYPQAYGDGNDSTKQELENATPEQLATAVRSKDIYKGHFDKNIKAGMSEDEAYQKARDQTISSIAEESGDAVGLATLALSMLAPGIGSVTANHYAGGAVSKWGQKVFNTLAAKADAGKVARVAIPAAVGTGIVGLNFTEEALQEGFTDYTAQKAAVDVGVKQKIDAEQNKEAMLMGGILGAALGGGAYVGTRNSKLHQAQDDLKTAQQAYAEVAGQIPQLQQQIEVVSPRSPEGQALTARVEETRAALDAMAAEAEKAGIPRTSLARRAPRIDPTNSAANNFDGQVEGATELSEQDFENALNPGGTPATQAPVVQPMSEAELDAQDAQLAELIAEQAALDEAIEDGSNEKPLEESIAAAQSWYDSKRGEGKQGLAGVVSRAAATEQDAAFAQQQEGIKGTTASINDYIASERAKQQQIEAQLQQEAQAATTDAEKQAVAQKIEQREINRAKEDELLLSREQLAQPYENESFDTTVIGADGAPFNLARFWDSNMPATAKAKAIADAFGGQVEQNVAKADWQSMPEGVQKELHQWFTERLDGVRQSREGAAVQTSEQVSAPAVEQPQEAASTTNGLTMPVRAEQQPVVEQAPIATAEEQTPIAPVEAEQAAEIDSTPAATQLTDENPVINIPAPTQAKAETPAPTTDEGIYKSKPAAKAAIKKQKLDPNSVTINQVKGGGFEIVPNTPEKPSYAQAEEQAATELGMTLNEDGEYGGTDAEFETFAKRIDEIQGRSLSNSAPTPQQNTVAPNNDVAIGKDGQAKWFGSNDKAQAFIDKKGIGDTHEVVNAGRSRFEIQPKAQITGATNQTSTPTDVISESGGPNTQELTATGKAKITGQEGWNGNLPKTRQLVRQLYEAGHLTKSETDKAFSGGIHSLTDAAKTGLSRQDQEQPTTKAKSKNITDEQFAELTSSRTTPSTPTGEQSAPAKRAAAKKAATQKPQNDVSKTTAPKRKTAAELRASLLDKNKVVTKEQADEFREILRSSGGTLNSGFDPQAAFAAMGLAAAYIEGGIRNFTDFATLLVDDAGVKVKRYLLPAWEAARAYDDLDTEGMTSTEDARADFEQLVADGFFDEVQEGQGTTEQAAESKHPKTLGSGDNIDTFVGENEDGKPLYEDKNGVRAIYESGIMVREPVSITPTGLESTERRDRYLTKDELAARENNDDTGTSNQDNQSRADGELSTADQADAESRNAGRSQAEPTSDVSDLDGRGARSDTIESDGDSRSAAARQRTDADDSDSRADSTQSNDGAAKETDATPTVKAKNYVISPADSNEKLSWQKVAERNVSIIELVKQLDSEDRQATANEQALLAQYAGWGASEIANGIFPNPDTGKYKSDSWQALGEKLQSLLTDSEYDTARRTTQYAHYTPPVLVEGIYKALENFGFKGGQVLEPASGIGVFNGLMPKKMADSSAYVGLELDPITGRIAQHLYPQSTMKIDDYIKAKLPDNHFDVAVGNPPFAGISVSYKGAGKNSTKQSMQLHDYFFAKTLDKLKPGGVMAFVTSKGTMDKKGSSVRELLAEQADLIGAIRLPQTAFKENAGTEVVTDIIFLRKRLEGEQPSDTAWASVKTIQASGKPTAINEYFVNNPDMVLGEHAITSGRFGDTYTVTPNKGDFASQVNQAIDKLPKDVFNPQRGSTAEAIKVAGLDYDAASSANKEGGVYLKDGNLMRVVDGVGKPLTQRYGTNGKAINLSAKDIAFMTDYVGVRDALKQAQRDQLNDSDTWEDSLAALNSTYDAFVKKHGPLMAHTVSERENNDGSVTVTKRFKNKQRLFLDVEGVLASALENVIDDGKGTVVKGSFFEGRSLRKPKAPTITSTQDALVYTLDEKGVLDIDRIAQVTNQSREQVITELGDQIYSDPTTNQWDLAETYLSGNVVEKLATAKAAAKNNSTYNRNVKALEAVQPAPIAPNDISSNMGAAWIPGSAIKEFSEEVLGAKIDAEYSSAVGLWDVSGNSRSSDYATADRTTVQLVESILNSRKISITRKSGDGGTFTDSVATELANEVARKIKTEFKKWLWSDDTRTQELADYYNKTYNNIVPPTFNGDHLTLAGMSNKIQLRAPQKRGIYRVIRQGDVYLNHAVGAGKTFTMIAAAMEEKRLGLINKPMFVVPNHMLDQFSQEFLMLYPAANIMVADEQNFHTHNRKQFVAQAALNTPDAIIITHSGFERIGVKPDTKKAFLESKIEEWQAALESTKASDGDNRTSVKQLERNIESLERNLDDILSAKEKDGAVFFEDMGVDKLYIDEAHEFRKLNFVTKMGNIKGIDPAGSQKAMDLDLKLQLLRKSNPTRAFVGASGTPVTNTMGELYTIQHYFQPEQLKQDGLHHFDSWANQFGEVVEGLEQNAAGNYEVVPRFARFVNVPELMSRVRSFMDVLTSQDLGDFVVRPNVHTGGREVVAIPTPDGFSEYQKTLSERIDAIRSRSGKPEKGDDIILSVIGDGRFSAIDMRFVDPELPSDPNSKLNQAIQNMADAYHATADNQYMTDGKPDQYKGGALMMFTDIGLGEQSAASRGFNMKEWISSELIRKGVKPEHIAFMRDNKTHAKKGKLFDDMRQGRKRIMIGGKDMETGVNAQKRLTHLFHLDAPWFPASVEQREGRIIRQGNQNKEVTVKAFATKGSYDSTMWSMVARKARFIEQAMRGDATVRSMDDVSEASAFEQASALSSGDPRSMQLAGLRQDVERLNRQLSGHQNEKFGNQNKARDARRTLARAERELDDINKLLPTHKNIETGDVIGKVGGKAFDNRAEFGQAIIAAYNKRADNFDTGEHVLGTAAGYDVVYNGVMMDGGNFYADANINIPKADDAALFDTDNAKDTRPDGLTTRIINRVNKLADYKSKIEQLIEQSKTNAENFERRANQSFDAQTELEEKSRELKELEDTLASEAEALKQDSNPNNFTDADRVPNSDSNRPTLDDMPKYSKTNPAKGNTGTTSQQVITVLQNRFGKEVVASLVKSGKLRVRTLNDFVNSDGRLLIPSDAEGFYYDGKVTLIADNLTPETAVATLLHEFGGHAGIQSMLAPQTYMSLMENFDALVRSGNKHAVKAKERAEAMTGSDSEARDEYIPYLITEYAQATERGGPLAVIKRFVNRVMAGVRAWVRKHTGVQLKMTPNDMVQLAERMVKRLAEQSADSMTIAGVENVPSGQSQFSQDSVDQTDTPAFKKWFGDSKVVDGNGNPLVVYHGTIKAFNEFNTTDFGALLGKGSYFTASESEASSYSGGGTRVVPAYLSIENPYYVDSGLASVPSRQQMLKDGYDGVIYRDTDGSVKWAVAHKPAQIKSATDNAGTFDNSNPDIRFSQVEAPQSQVDAVRKQYEGADQWMKSPNGKKTKLTERQWLQVRTPAFKEWFGDWEGDPDNASKIVEANGEPKIMYHGTGSMFSEFDMDRAGELTGSKIAEEGIFFTDIKDVAQSYKKASELDNPNLEELGEVLDSLNESQIKSFATDVFGWHKNTFDDYSKQEMIDEVVSSVERDSEEAYQDSNKYLDKAAASLKGYGIDFLAYEETGQIMEAFLNIRSPEVVDADGSDIADISETIEDSLSDIRSDKKDGYLLNNVVDQISFTEKSRETEISNVVMVFNPNQIKSATDNVGTFDPSNPDIRFSRRYSTLGTDGKPVTAKEKARDRVALAQATTMSSKFGINLLLRRHLATPQHVALLNPVFKIFTDNVQARIAYENNEAGLVQTLLPEIWDTRIVVGKKKAAMERVSKAIFDGTMADKVWSDSELQTMFNLTDKDIGFYRRARAAIDTSVMNMTVDTLSSLAKGTKLVNIEAIHKLKLQGMHPIFHNLALQQHMTDELEKLAKGGLITPKAEARMQKQLDDVFDVMAAIAMKYDKLVADGYAPLMRFGHYAVEVRDKTTNDLDLFELYETKGQQRKAIKELKDRYDETQFTVGTGTLNPEGFKQFKNKGLSPETVQLFASELGLDDDGAYQAYLKIAVSDRSALKRLIHRKKVPGYSEDMPRVLSAFVMSNARYSGRGLYNSEIERSIQNIDDGNLQNEAQKVFENIENPQEEFAQQRSLMFHYFMGFSPAFFFLNLTQPFTQTIPKLTAYVGAGKGHAYMAQALGIVGKHIGRSTVELGKKIAGMPAPNWGGFEDNLPAWVKREDYLRMAREGHLDPQNIYMIKGLERGKGGVASGVWGNIEAAAGWFAEVSESINRRSTMIAAFRVAKDMGDAKLKAKGFDSKYEFAVSMIQQTQGIYNKGNRSGLARGNGKLGQYGPLILVFKQFTINYTEQMIRHGRDKEVKALAVAMMWQYILAGMLGLPFADDLRDLFEGIAYRVFGKAFNLPDYLQEKLGKSNADALMYGIASEKGPIDIHGRSSLGNIIPGTDVIRPGPTDWAEVLGASSGFYESFFSAASMAADGKYKDALITASPRYIRDAASGAEIALTGSYRNTKGDKIMDLDGKNAFIKAMQFNPSDNARPGRDRSNAYQMKNMLKAKTDYFSKHLAEAIYQENDERVDELYNEMDAWNERNAEHFNVDIDKIEKSAEKRVERKDFGSDERQNIQDSLALRQEELAGT